MITPRTTSLVRTADLAAFREALVALATGGPPLAARDRVIIVPTRAAGAQLIRTIENARFGERADGQEAVILPVLVTAGELVSTLAERLPLERPVLSAAEREVLLGVCCRAAHESGTPALFGLRPGIIADILQFYDTLRRQQKDVDAFERLALGTLEPGALDDRGAARLVEQTRFLVAAFREFDRRSSEAGLDEQQLRERLLRDPATRPVTHVVVAVGDRGSDPYGLWQADWDLLARLPGLSRLDIVVTDTALAGAPHERMHRLLPGIEEVRFESQQPSATSSRLVLHDGAVVQTLRDREEEVAAFARRVRHVSRTGGVSALDRVALVVRQPLPYVYLAREVLRAGGVPCQMFDALPLAGEPYAAALDLVFSCVSGGFARTASLALLRSPHFAFGGNAPLALADLAALDRALAEAGYLGELEPLDALIAKWRDANATRGDAVRALRAAETVRELAFELATLRTAAPVAAQLDCLIAFLRAYDSLPGPDDPLRQRQLRARSAILGTLAELRDAYARFDDRPVDFDVVAALVRRWIEGQTFAPRVGDGGVHLVDAASAPFGDFELVQLAGLVDGEWPDPPRRSIFYSASILRDLGWPAESERADAARAAFRDLLTLPRHQLVLSTFSLEADAIVSPSMLLDQVALARFEAIPDDAVVVRSFEHEALALSPMVTTMLTDAAREWAELRAPIDREARRPGTTGPHEAPAFSLSALERYQDCPFKFFASDVLQLQEAPEDESTLSPRTRGRFIHELFQRFFEAWDRSGGGTITTDKIDAARALCRAAAEPLLARLPDADAALERTRLFGSPISVGIVDVVLGVEASRPVAVRERWLEYRLEGSFTLAGDGAPIALRGVADRIDLLAGRRLRVVDYKSGPAPHPRRALQVPIYALCAQERLTERDGEPWTIDDASYVALTGKRTLVQVVRAGAADAQDVLADARSRVQDVLSGVAAGVFPPRPHDEMICRWCAFTSVCRKDYVGDD